MDATPKHAPGRRLTMLLYLNPEWQNGDGGELRLHLKKIIEKNNSNNDNNNDDNNDNMNDDNNDDNNDEIEIDTESTKKSTEFIDIAPLGGRLLIFQSRALLHEVLPSNAEWRYSLTMWVY